MPKKKGITLYLECVRRATVNSSYLVLRIDIHFVVLDEYPKDLDSR
jgi:hypothetical protein